MNRRDFVKNAVKTSFIFAGGLWLPKIGILRPTDAEAGLFQHAAGASGFLTRVYAGITLKMSTVAGTAFITQVSGSIPWAQYINRKVTISDGTNTVVGWVTAVGSGETYASNTVTNAGFTSDTSGWSPVGATLSSVAGGESGNCLSISGNSGDYKATTQSQNKTSDIVTGNLYRLSAYIKSGTAGNVNAVINIYADANPWPSIMSKVQQTSSSWVGINCHGTGIATGASVFRVELKNSSASSGSIFFDTVAVQRVLTPDTTGITIASTRGGATQSWTSNSGINPNAASFTVTVSA